MGQGANASCGVNVQAEIFHIAQHYAAMNSDAKPDSSLVEPNPFAEDALDCDSALDSAYGALKDGEEFVSADLDYMTAPF